MQRRFKIIHSPPTLTESPPPKQSHDQKMTEKKKTLSRIRHQISEKISENESLEVQLSDLSLAVQERQTIFDIQTTQQVEDTGSKRKMNKVLQRRKMLDIIKIQEEELERLRHESKKLREKN